MGEHMVDVYAERKRLNDLSQRWARRQGKAWTAEEDELLMKEWIPYSPEDRDEITISQVCERTIEACRVRCEKLRKEHGLSLYVKQTTTTTTTTYIGACDEPDDCWWSPDYYNKRS